MNNDLLVMAANRIDGVKENFVTLYIEYFDQGLDDLLDTYDKGKADEYTYTIKSSK